MKITKGKLELKVPPSKYLQTIVEEIRENLQRMGVSQLPRILDAELVTMLAANNQKIYSRTRNEVKRQFFTATRLQCHLTA